MASYESTPLFQGSIVCDIPANFTNIRNISKAYPVPNHQEVFVARDGFMSIIIDILERVDEGGDDDRALETHLEDIDEKLVEQEGTRQRTEFSKLPKGIPAYTLLAKIPPEATPLEGEASSAAAQQQQPSSELAEMPDTMMVLTLLRLERESTDIVITVNMLNIRQTCAEDDARYADQGEDEDERVARQMAKRGRIIGDAAGHAGRIWETFDIKEWELFGAS
ncbi:Mog1p/PsbP-like protein [Xylariaceae sp. FL0594]|nr:Mog1p/PsbP-like protein [Xylariaceae sp. FL0594]